MASERDILIDNCKQIITLATAVIAGTLAAGLDGNVALRPHSSWAIWACFSAGIAIASSLLFCFCAAGNIPLGVTRGCKTFIVVAWLAFLASIFCAAKYVVFAI